MNPDVLAQAMRLWRGNDQAYWTEGRMCVRQPLTTEVWERHFTANPGIGVYPLVHGRSLPGIEIEPTVWWGCSDIDMPKLGGDPNDPTLAVNLFNVLRAMGITSWVERSKSKGFHVWVFAAEPVPASVMRNALLVAHQVGGVPPTEVNPKQVSGVELGNLVRVPYAHSRPSPDRQVILSNTTAGEVLTLERAVERCSEKLVSPAQLRAAAALYVPPQAVSKVEIFQPSGHANVSAATDKLGGLGWTIYSEGPTEKFGYDRSRTLQRLAFICRDDGLSASEAYEVVSDADVAWGKFHSRPDGAKHIRKMIERAYG